MARFGILVDMDRCNGCHACVMACRDEHCGNDHLPYAAAKPYFGSFWMRVSERERGNYPHIKTCYYKIPCMHCDDAPCIREAPDKIYKREDGIVIIDPAKAKCDAHEGKEIQDSCPYGAIYWNDEKGLPQKCTLCAHLLDAGWKEPRCTEVCPNKGITFGDFDDPNSEVSQRIKAENAEFLHPEFGLSGSVYFVNMPKRFVSGSLVFGDTKKSAKKVTVDLVGEDFEAHTVSNGFGDFEFEGLEKNKKFTIRVRCPGYKDAEVQVATYKDNDIGDIVLEKA
ncbi:MAG: 4Fe-4S dicluster domain-containing protein [Thermoleophilia bacterium]|jgi:Fe-S-cluster-containing dehydrogenase component